MDKPPKYKIFPLITGGWTVGGTLPLERKLEQSKASSLRSEIALGTIEQNP
jgi:hypothetical protein